MLLQPLEMVIPELLVLRNPFPHRSELGRDQPIVPLSALPLFRHESSIQQDAKVLRYSRPAHLEMSRDRLDGSVGLKQEIQHPATRGVADGPEDIRLTFINGYHAATICKKTLTSQARSGGIGGNLILQCASAEG